jgi:hypothetical protein
MSQVWIIAFQEFIEFFNEKRIVFVRMSLQQGYFYLFYSVLVDDGEYLIDVGLIDEALYDSELFVSKNLLMD